LSLFFRNSELYIANVGDSRAVISSRGIATRVTTDHKPDLPAERERIEKLGGWVKNGAITGSITVSRSLGDFSYKPFIICDPDVFGPFRYLDDEYQFLILACDGLWDVVTDQEAVEIALSAKTPEEAAVKLRDKAFNNKSRDNISVLVIFFPQYQNIVTLESNSNIKITKEHESKEITVESKKKEVSADSTTSAELGTNHSTGMGTLKKRIKTNPEKKDDNTENSNHTYTLKKSTSKNHQRTKKKDKSSKKISTNLEPSASKKTRPVSKSDAAEKPKKSNIEKAKTGDDE